MGSVDDVTVPPSAPSAVIVKARGRGGISYRNQEVLWSYLLLAPAILGLFAFTLGPALASLLLALFSTNFINDTHWVGLGNFEDMAGDSTFWISTLNTFVYVIGHIGPTVILALAMAVALNQRIRGRALFRTIYFLPVVTPVVSTTLVWAWAYQTDFGVFNFFLRSLGLPPIPWLSDSSWAMPSIIIWSIWAGVGYPIILFLAALQNVSPEQVEAAQLDGASGWETFRYVTFPAISPTTFFIVILQFVGSFQVFTETYVMTKGGPGYATNTLVMYLYDTGWNTFRFGYASAVAVFIFIVLALVTLIQFRLQSQWVYYEHD